VVGVKLISVGVLLAFSFIGFFLVGNILHEQSHRHDFREINKTQENTCYLSFSNSTAYYSFSAVPGQDEKIDSISKITELKAYSIDFFLFLVYFASLFIFLKSLVSR
jgi:hypothetical protein